MFDVRCSVKSVKGFCSAGYKVGDHFFIKNGVMLEAGEPKGLCIYAVGGLLPYLTAYCRQTPDGDWINNKKELQCPDNDNAVIFSLERIKK
ncbi:MAG TPA: TIGR04076 family protein [Deltaproteobacteria bacterium]|nr:TIGR04076 family protein [Deltaproteobacteria bacterium]